MEKKKQKNTKMKKKKKKTKMEKKKQLIIRSDLEHFSDDYDFLSHNIKR